MKAAVLCACLVALAACSMLPTGDEVIAQARPDGDVAFDVVKIDEAVLKTLLAQPQPAFGDRFKKYVPPPELKLAVGDMLAVVIWESGSNGLFGNSLTELSFPAGAAARALSFRTPNLGGVPASPLGLTSSATTLEQLYGGAPSQGPAPTTTQPNAASNETGAGLAAPGRGTGGRTALGAEASTSQSGGPAAPAGLGALAGAGVFERGAGSPLARLAPTSQQLLDVATQTGRPGTLIPPQQVGPDGAISVPYAGRIEAAGRTPAEVAHRIETQLATKALDPQVLVLVNGSPANSVSVTGEAVRGARVPLLPGGDRLLQVIAAAGGGNAPVHDTFVRLSRGGVTAAVPLATLVSDPSQDVFAEPGDVVTLVRRPQTFSVFGATSKNAAITFNSDRLSLAEAVGKAGGLLDDRADARAVFVFRYEPDSVVRALGQPIATGAHGGVSPVAYRLDLKDAGSYPLAQRFPLHDKDIIFVANAKTQGIYNFFSTLQNVTGPVVGALGACATVKC